ncbi:IS3 family transposase [Allorhizobium ampelinum]|uniref:IS3 family transposase n=1 Tax=Allorhizobium ampelinum TaxID=3025782 RepID=UPI003AB96AA7
MAAKRHKAEEIVTKLRQVDVLNAQGKSMAEAIRSIGVTEVTYSRWRAEYGGLKGDQVKRLKELETENARLRRAVSDLTLDKMILAEAAKGKLLSPARRRACVDHVTAELGVSERRACRVLGQHRSTQRKIAKTPADEAALTADITALALQYGRYGYRRITAMLHQAGWIVNVKRVERIWRREGLKVPYKQPKRGRLWLNESSCIRLRPEYPNHVWSYDFVEDRTHNGRKLRMLNEFIAKALREWIALVGAKTAYIMPGSPWENGYCESFNSKLRDELLNGEIFYTLKEAKIIIESWRQHYNTVRPHSSLNYKPPAPEATVWPRQNGPASTPAVAARPSMH